MPRASSNSWIRSVASWPERRALSADPGREQPQLGRGAAGERARGVRTGDATGGSGRESPRGARKWRASTCTPTCGCRPRDRSDDCVVGDRPAIDLLSFSPSGLGPIRLPFVAARERSQLHEFRAVAAAIVQGRPPSVAFPHWRWRLRMNYLTGYASPYWCGQGSRPACLFYEPNANEVPRAGAWVVVDRKLSRSWPPGSTNPPKWMTAPPSNWAVRLNVGSVLVVAVPADFDPMSSP